MRSFSGLLVLLLVIALVVLAVMNPQMDEFETFAAGHLQAHLQERISERTGSPALGRVFSDAGAGIAQQYVGRFAERKGYVVASTYTLDLDGPHRDELEWKFLGVADRFVPLSMPDPEQLQQR